MLPEPLCYRLGRPIREECHGWSCTATLLIIRTTPKPGKMPHLNPCWRGQRHGFTPFCQSGDSPELAQGLPYKGKSMRNRGVSSPMPFLLIPRSLLRGGFIQLVLFALIWLFVVLHLAQPKRAVTAPDAPADPEPAKPKRYHSNEPKPFEGLTHKP